MAQGKVRKTFGKLSFPGYFQLPPPSALPNTPPPAAEQIPSSSIYFRPILAEQREPSPNNGVFEQPQGQQRLESGSHQLLPPPQQQTQQMDQQQHHQIQQQHRLLHHQMYDLDALNVAGYSEGGGGGGGIQQMMV
jgi:hypothetical protein